MTGDVPSASSAPSPHVDVWAEEDTRHLEVAYLWDRIRWLVRLRWFASAGVVLVIGLAHQFGAVGTGVPLAGVAASLIAANLVFRWMHGRTRKEQRLEVLQRHVLLQLLVDVAALATMLHWSDGVENPFAMFYAFHMAIAAKLLPPRMAYTVAAVATGLQGGIVLAEHTGLLAHHGLFAADEGERFDPIIESAPYLATYLVAFALTMVGTVYFMSVTARRYREAQAARARAEKLAASREKFAHLGELSGGVAHSIRNPLHGLMNCVEILRGQVPPDGDALETLGLMDDGLGRIHTLTHRLLTYTRNAPIQPRDAELGEFVDDTLRFLKTGVHRDAAEVARLPGPAVVASVDPDRLSEALLNVLDNAVDACRAGGTVTVRVATHSDGMAIIEVKDTGPGIRPEDLARVFDPFFTTKPVGQGTGLGLAITRRIVEDHGGTVDVLSMPGAGTRVRLFLPAARVERNLQGSET